MAEVTKIQWCDHTFNPWRGCTKVSAGCANCYADTLSVRNPKVLGVWGPSGTRVVAAESYWREPLKWNKQAACTCNAPLGQSSMRAFETCPQHRPVGRPRVFCASLADLFEDWQGPMVDSQGRELQMNATPEQWGPQISHGPLSMQAVRMRLFRLIRDTPNLDWLILTKRPQNVLPMLTPVRLLRSSPSEPPTIHANVWLGTSVENQATADERIPHLLATPAAVRFLSVEPVLGPVNLSHQLRKPHYPGLNQPCGCPSEVDDVRGAHESGCQYVRHACKTGDSMDCWKRKAGRIDWVIAGGESGPDSRECRVEWIRDIVRQCRSARVPVFVKQLGSRATGDYYEDRDEYESVRGVDWPAPTGWNCRDGQPPIGSRVLLPLSDSKGGDPAEWPRDLLVREFPQGG